MNRANAFLLIASPSENHEGKRISALTMAKRRLEAKQWGLWIHTPHQKDIKNGDLCIIYIAGSDGKQFVAYAFASSVRSEVSKYLGDGDALTDYPTSVLHLDKIHWFASPISITTLKDRLEFIPKGVIRWGCVLQRGVKKISSKDAETILKTRT